MLTEEEKTKAVKQMKLQLNGVFQPFMGYGLKLFVPSAIEQVTELALLLHKRLNGQDIPITFEHANGKLKERIKASRKAGIISHSKAVRVGGDLAE